MKTKLYAANVPSTRRSRPRRTDSPSAQQRVRLRRRYTSFRIEQPPMRPWLLLPLASLTLAATAQSTSAKLGTGTVTGHVYCADTNAPARMASVQLEPISHAEKLSGPPIFTANGSSGRIVQTALDGGFVIPSVAPGAYYVVVNAPGYLPPEAADDDIDDTGPRAPSKQPRLVIPKVDVTADQAANIDVRVERGAAVSGTLSFDDGSPAPGVMVAVLHRRKGKWVESESHFRGFLTVAPPITDDLGRYRIGGLRGREYIVRAVIFHMDMTPPDAHGTGMSALMRSAITVYSGDAMRPADAVAFTLHAGEERTGEDITIPLSKLHLVTGVVVAARDGHAVDGGDVQIELPGDDNSISQAGIDKDGSFRLEGVPEGAYELRVRNAHDTKMEEVRTSGQTASYREEKPVHQYGDLDQTIKVEGDIPNLVLAVPEQKHQTGKGASQ